MNAQTVIQQLGYPANHAKIYLASLKMGEAVIAEIAQQVGMPRTTVAESLEEMHKSGLMNYYVKRGRKHWTAEHPDKLMEMLKEREQSLERVLPSLRALGQGGVTRPSVKFYSGVDDIKAVFDDMISSKHHIMAMMAWDDLREAFGEDFMSDVIERRYSHFLKISMIAPRSASALELKKRDLKEMRQTRFLPPTIELRRISNYIYGDKIAIISLNRKEPTGLVIQDPDVARANAIYFESLWRHSLEQ